MIIKSPGDGALGYEVKDSEFQGNLPKFQRMMKKGFHKPAALREGDTIALVRPGSRISEEQFQQTAKHIRSLGFCVALYPGKYPRDSYFASSDKGRAEELLWAFSEPGIKAIWVCRGGYGAVRTLQRLTSHPLYKKTRGFWIPKLFIGFSDTTYIHQWLQNELKWITIYGPLASFLKKPELKETLNKLTTLPTKSASQIWKGVQCLKPGMAEGRLVGGTLSLLQVAGLAALPKEPMILAFEDVSENFYRIDRMLWALIDAGYSSYVKGVIVGNLHQCGRDDRKSFSLKRIHETLQRLTSGPIWWNGHFGHGVNNQRLLPLGCQVKIEGRTLRILESVVS